MSTINYLYDDYIYTIKKCKSSLLNESDEKIEHDVFEEFDIGMVSFLHEKSLNELLKSNHITKNVYEKSKVLRTMAMSIQDDNLWDINSFKTLTRWKELLELGDEINSLLSDDTAK